MSLKRIFPERGSYKVSSPNNSTQMAEIKRAEHEKPSAVQYETKMATTSLMPSSSLPTLSSTPMQQNQNIGYDVIDTAPLNASTTFQNLHWENQRSYKKVEFDIDSGSQSSKDNKCDKCLINCLYYTHECCDCTIL
ncbi:PREDICTED: uncharacterized protein LOC106791318 [Polistes canadensis]|uniref:uncharacterized protein LOC106791318 n=1 Tax=Polistes canadensis TaxID=91411 RepID=UPI000718CE93|nr:PREDICTED: uncharacterized protein LOC106791318 [Polistes canadensis]